MTSTEIPAITEMEWEKLAENWPPVVEREDGSLLIISGKWSEGKRTYDYATLEVSGQTPGTVGPEVARSVASARGKDVEDYRHDADAEYDGTGYRAATEQSRVTVWWVAPGVPTRLKCGQTYTSSGHIRYGGAKVHFYGGPTSGPAYRSQSQKFKQTHHDVLSAPATPTPKQVETLQKFANRAKDWNLGRYAIPHTADGAKRVLNALAENHWKLRSDGYADDPLSVWRQVLREEQPPQPSRSEPEPGRGGVIHISFPDEEYEPGE